DLPHVASPFFFIDTSTTEIYTLSLHDALPIFGDAGEPGNLAQVDDVLRLDEPELHHRDEALAPGDDLRVVVEASQQRDRFRHRRSEERRVGKECSSRWARAQ